MKDVLITGGGGQLGLELQRLDWGDDIRIHAPARDQLELADAAGIAALFERVPFAAVINSAAYTAVDKAEGEVGAAFAANALGPALLAQVCARAAIPLIHVSTDYVFDGSKDGLYLEEDPIGPLGVYGASKLAGELAVLSGCRRAVVLRTAWVLSAHRGNFVKTMRRLAATRPEINVVADQLGCPTAAGDIALAIQAILAAHLAGPGAPVGVYHFVNAGEASWCDLANAVFAMGAATAGRVTARPITTADYPTPARRPANSRLATHKITRDFGVVPRPWRDAVADIIGELDQMDGATARS
jgi:dTDP-4-dehydrorhamnose reductase